MKIADLFAEVGFKFDSIKLREVSKLIGDLNIASIVGATSLVALGEGIKNLIESSSQLSSNLLTLQANTGIDTKFAQQFEDASKALGSSKEAADGLITSLSKIRNDVALGKGIPLGLQLLGYNKEDFEGTLEDTIKMIQRKLSQALPANATQAQKEHFAGLISAMSQSIGATPDMLKVLTNPNLFNLMDKFLYLTQNEIKANKEATTQWQLAVQNVNTELMITADKLLPAITDILKSFNEGGGFQAFVKDLKFVTDTITKLGLVKDISENYLKATLLNIGSFASHPLINAAKLGNELRRDFNAAVTNVRIDVAPITIQANDPHEFVKKFDDHFKKYMALTSSQFTLGQT